jgi:hypothetical protein
MIIGLIALERLENCVPENTFARSSCEAGEIFNRVKAKEENNAYDFHGSTIVSHPSSILRKCSLG